MSEKRQPTANQLRYHAPRDSVSTEILDEICESIGADLYIQGKSELEISYYQFHIRACGWFFSTLRTQYLGIVNTVLSKWFLELDEVEGERFSDAYELLTIAIDIVSDIPAPSSQLP